MTAKWSEVARLDQLLEGRPTIVRAKGKEIALTLWRGEVFALRNICPHQTQSFAGGRTRVRLTGTVGQVDVVDGDPMLICPWHTWPFRLRTGECPIDPSLRVKAYGVEVRDGTVLVAVD
jgi:nitrite reductase (NADH) small subunit